MGIMSFLLRKVIVSLTSEDYKHNAAHMHMSPDEARTLAQLLIIYANILDPIVKE